MEADVDRRLVVMVCPGPGVLAAPVPAGWSRKRLAPTPMPSPASLAATVATGVWPERHGVVFGRQPHPDRLGMVWSAPEFAGCVSIWSRLLTTGRRVAVLQWPYGVDLGDVENGDGCALISASAMRMEMGAEGMHRLGERDLSPMSLRDLVRGSLLAVQPGPERWRIAIDALVETDPHLLLAWCPVIPRLDACGEAERVRHLLATRCGGTVDAMVLRHPPSTKSILDGGRCLPAPWIAATSPALIPPGIRPRIDATHDVVVRAFGLDRGVGESRSSAVAVDASRLDARHVPRAQRMSSHELAESERTTLQSIGAHLLGRGEAEEAMRWLKPTVIDQHLGGDPSSLLLLAVAARHAGRLDVLEMLRSRIGGGTLGVVVEHLAASGSAPFPGDAWLQSIDRSSLRRFVFESVLVSLGPSRLRAFLPDLADRLRGPRWRRWQARVDNR